MKRFSQTLLAILCALCGPISADAESRRPNIVFIGADDLAVKEPTRVAELSALWDQWNAEQSEPLWK